MRKRGAARLLLAFLVLALVLGSPLEAWAATSKYVSLGDSIAVGLNASPGHGYFDLFSAYLGPRYDSVDLAVEGKMSPELLADLTTPGSETRQRVAGAKVITISIGANNLLGPVLGAVYADLAQYGVTPAGKTTPEFEAAIAEFINTHPAEWAGIVADVKAKVQPGGALYPVLQDGVTQFLDDWPRIVRAVHALAPAARVYVLTLYNPLLGDPALGREYASLVFPMNAAIRLTPFTVRGASFVDASVLFALYPAALSLDLTAFPATAASVDPHPTTFGHWLIYRSLVSLEKLR